MSPEEAVAKLRKIVAEKYTEDAHIAADDIMCEILKSHGYTEFVAEYEKMEKWFA